MTKHLITIALPYSNGDLHIGHLLEAVEGDVFARRQKQRAKPDDETLFVCADDQHGSAITIRAEKEGISPEELIGRLRAAHVQDFNGFHVEFDHYHATHSEENRALCELVYGRLKDAGLIYKAPVTQLFDESAGVFLADRLVKGGCPSCQAPDQHGDNCEKCGAIYGALELLNPVSQVSGVAPQPRVSDHVFFKLSDPEVQSFCRAWAAEPGRLAPEARNKLAEWLESDLRDWDISRDGPYFGFEIPGETNKFFYVWVDAPLGYLASATALLASQGRPKAIGDIVDPSSDWQITHVIGKDILYFHALFWPALLRFSGFRTPSSIKTHGFLTFEGRKLSKSKGTLIGARQYLEAGLDPEWLRFYFFSKINGGSQDVDFSPSDFINRVDSDLVGKYANIASRLSPFFSGSLDSVVSVDCSGHPLVRYALSLEQDIDDAFDELDFAKACRLIFSIADEANKLISEAKPWLLAKDPALLGELARVACAGLCAFECITRHLSPAIPAIARAAFAFLNTVDDGRAPSTAIEPGRKISAFAPLATRVDKLSLAGLLPRQSSTPPCRGSVGPVGPLAPSSEALYD